jgi:hypothetical protein
MGVLTVRDRVLTPVLAEQAAAMTTQFGLTLPPTVLVDAVSAWTQVFGIVSFELFGQFVGSVDPSDEFFADAVERMADLVGLPGEIGRFVTTP